jgi:hypothetical protein
MSDMKHVSSAVVFLLFLLFFSTAHSLAQQQLSVSNHGTITYSTSDSRTYETMINGIWTWKSQINSVMLEEMVSHNIFNIFVYVGYPTPDFDPRLSGIVPDTNYGINTSPQEVQSLKQQLASVDSRLKLWAWFGTYSTLSPVDGISHDLAEVDLSTSYNRQVIIENMVEVANWGFYGVQDDTEDVIYDSLNQKYQNQFDLWNEEQIALNQIGVKLATFTYSGPPSFWTYNPPYEFVKQLDVDYIILVQSIWLDSKDVWISEVKQAASAAKSPILVRLEYAYSSSFPTVTEQIEWLKESGISFSGCALYLDYPDGAQEDWVAWDNYLLTFGE